MENNLSYIVCNNEDISSFANFQQFRQEHIHIDNKIDFENQRWANLFITYNLTINIGFMGLLKSNSNLYLKIMTLVRKELFWIAIN